MSERQAMELAEAVEKVIEIGKRFERQQQLAEELARIERNRARQRKDAAKAQTAGLWR
jgi:hypothetical protein